MSKLGCRDFKKFSQCHKVIKKSGFTLGQYLCRAGTHILDYIGPRLGKAVNLPDM